MFVTGTASEAIGFQRGIGRFRPAGQNKTETSPPIEHRGVQLSRSAPAVMGVNNRTACLKGERRWFRQITSARS
jgi:hypothetical protein